MKFQQWNIKADPDRQLCDFGNWKYNPFTGPQLPKGFSVVKKPAPELLEVESPADLPRPSMSWDGRESTLGFPLPEKGTPLYNMLLCWPYDVRLKQQLPQGVPRSDLPVAG